tara:strand:- start:407 stop:1477 length:1071 start_codon:yes stop_codon:yes gene_type:complete
MRTSKDAKEYFESKEIKELRQDLLQGIKNKNCEACWIDEKNGGDSLRLISNRTIAHRGNFKISDQIKEPKLQNILSFDLTLGNLCNLKCVMCNPELSSQVLAEANANDNLKELYNANTDFAQKSFDWPKQQEFIDWCQTHLPQAVHIKFTGGEPFIIPWIDRVIEHIPDEQKAKCILHFTSNLTVINDKLFRNIHKFKEVWISVSVEGIEDTFEYLRYGHKWNKLKQNLQIIRKMKIPNLILKVNHVVQAPSFQSIQKMVKYFDKLKMEINPILLRTPKHFTLASLTKECKQDFLSNTSTYSGYNEKFISYVRSVVEQNMDHERDGTDEMLKHLSRLDRVRGNNFSNVIPSRNINQ